MPKERTGALVEAVKETQISILTCELDRKYKEPQFKHPLKEKTKAIGFDRKSYEPHNVPLTFNKCWL